MTTLLARFALYRTDDLYRTDYPGNTVGEGVQFPSGLITCQVRLGSPDDPPTLEGATSIEEFTGKLPDGIELRWIDNPTRPDPEAAP